MKYADEMEGERIKDLQFRILELETQLDEREELLDDIYQLIPNLWEKAGLNNDHPVFLALLDRISEIKNEHDGKLLTEILLMDPDITRR